MREAFEENTVEEASPVTRLLIPKLGVDTIVVEGTSKEALDAGAGHRTTYGKPFADIDRLTTGDGSSSRLRSATTSTRWSSHSTTTQTRG